MPGGEGERRRAAARVADEVEPLEAMRIGLAQDPRALHAEVVVRRRPFRGVDLEILRDRINALPEHLKQRGVGRFGRQHSTGQEHDGYAVSMALTLPSRAERAERLWLVSLQELTQSASASPTTGSSFTSHDRWRKKACSITWLTPSRLEAPSVAACEVRTHNRSSVRY